MRNSYMWLLAAVVGLCVACGSHSAKTTRHTASTHAPVRRVTDTRPRRLVERVSGSLPAALQDPGAVSLGSHVLLLGGLTAADTSTGSIIDASAAGAREIGVLPSPRHDTAAARVGGAAYVFGGGTGSAQLDEIVRVDPATGRSSVVGRLPAASSDSAAAAIGGTAYVVGGYTGSRWLDTIVAWRPGRAARIVARLPSAVRYAAVTAVGDRLLIAGGSLPNGTASSAVLEYLPASRRVLSVGRLPAPTTHAAAATLDGIAYVIGGRGAVLDTPTARIVAVDPVRSRIIAAGRLGQPRSDLAATTTERGILVAGGHGSGGTVATLSLLVPAPAGAVRRTSAAARAVNVYAHDAANRLTGAARFARPLIYVPNSQSDTVDVIDPHAFKIVELFAVGALPQHVVPAWNLRTLYVTNDLGNSLTPIDPRTGKPGAPIPVEDPYNMYFTPDGRYAIVVAERLHRLDFRNPHTFALVNSVNMPCVGPDHMDFSAAGDYALVSCEFSGQMVKVDVANEQVVGTLPLPGGGAPQDVKLSPDGRVFYVADMDAGGIWEIDGARLRVIGFLRTGAGAHGLYPSRDAKYLYVTNRSEGSISVVSFATRKQVTKWRIPGGGSPDMGGVSADGSVLWLSGRYNGVVYAISTKTGRLLARIPVGAGPHGLCVWPQPGRYSLGHTGILR
jgi:DNA-binding beta-propeller fold protein YncE